MPPQRRAAKPTHSRLHRPPDWTTAAAIFAGLTLYWLAEAAVAALTPDAFGRDQFAYSVGLLVAAGLLTWQSAQVSWRLWQNRPNTARQATLIAALSAVALLAACALAHRYLPLAVTPWPLYAALLARRATPTPPAGSPTASAKARPGVSA